MKPKTTRGSQTSLETCTSSFKFLCVSLSDWEPRNIWNLFLTVNSLAWQVVDSMGLSAKSDHNITYSNSDSTFRESGISVVLSSTTSKSSRAWLVSGTSNSITATFQLLTVSCKASPPQIRALQLDLQQQHNTTKVWFSSEWWQKWLTYYCSSVL